MRRQVKESAARMERIPSTLVIHKRPDGVDTRMVSMRHPLVNNPVQKWLGAIDSGAYQPAAITEAHSFVKVEDMWSDPIDKQNPKMKKSTMLQHQPCPQLRSHLPQGQDQQPKIVSSINYTGLSTKAATDFASLRINLKDKQQRHGT
jgi:hypothetical protein